MDRLSLKAKERDILGKKVKNLRNKGFLPAHIFGKNISSESILVDTQEFMRVYHQAGESGLIDLKIGSDKTKPVLVREVQMDPQTDRPFHIDFYQVNLTQKVSVSVSVVLIGEEPEVVHMGEAVVIQPMNEIEVEALPAELPEHIEVDISQLQQIGDAILVSSLSVPTGVTLLADPEATVVKLDNAVTEETQEEIEEEQAAEAQEEEAAGESGGEQSGEENKQPETSENSPQ